MTIEIGVLFNTDRMSGRDFLEYAKRLESAAIESMWLAELFGREPFTAAAAVLQQTSTLRVGTAIANIYARDASWVPLFDTSPDFFFPFRARRGFIRPIETPKPPSDHKRTVSSV